MILLRCLVVVFLFFVLSGCSDNSPASDNGNSAPATVTAVMPGYLGRLHTPAGDIVPAATSAKALDRLVELSIAHDLDGIDQMRAAGEIIAVPDQTRCRVISRTGILTCEVRLLNAGGHPLPTAYFVSREWIK